MSLGRCWNQQLKSSKTHHERAREPLKLKYQAIDNWGGHSTNDEVVSEESPQRWSKINLASAAQHNLSTTPRKFVQNHLTPWSQYDNDCIASDDTYFCLNRNAKLVSKKKNVYARSTRYSGDRRFELSIYPYGRNYNGVASDTPRNIVPWISTHHTLTNLAQ